MNHNVSKFNCIYKDCTNIANSNKDPLHCNIHDYYQAEKEVEDACRAWCRY